MLAFTTAYNTAGSLAGKLKLSVRQNLHTHCTRNLRLCRLSYGQFKRLLKTFLFAQSVKRV